MRRTVDALLTAPLGWALAVVLSCTPGCVSTTTTEREVGVPSMRLQDDLLPGPPELEAILSRHQNVVRVELSRIRSCRRREITRVQHEKVEQSRVGTGTLITGISLAAIGLATTAVLVVAGGVVLGVGLLGTGTTTSPLPETETFSPATRVPCNRTPAAGVVVQLVGESGQYQGTTDERGRLELSEVEPGPLRLQVDGEPVKLQQAERREAARPPRPKLSPEPAKRADKHPLKPARAKPAEPVEPADTLPLPPPPPPPPGVRLLPD